MSCSEWASTPHPASPSSLRDCGSGTSPRTRCAQHCTPWPRRPHAPGLSLTALPLYPEERRCAHPTTEQVLRLFSHAERHVLTRAGRVVQSFDAEFTPLQHQVLALLGVPANGFRG